MIRGAASGIIVVGATQRKIKWCTRSLLLWTTGSRGSIFMSMKAPHGSGITCYDSVVLRDRAAQASMERQLLSLGARSFRIESMWLREAKRVQAIQSESTLGVGTF